MYVKKLLKFNNSLGLILPMQIVKAIDLHWQDLIVISLEADDKVTIVKFDKWRAKRKKA